MMVSLAATLLTATALIASVPDEARSPDVDGVPLAASHHGSIEGDRILWRTTIEVADPHRGTRHTTTTSEQPRRVPLAPPLVGAPTRVTLDGGFQVELSGEARAALGVEQRIGHQVAAGVSDRDRRRLDRKFGDVGPSANALYLSADAGKLLPDGRLGGKVLEVASRRRAAVVGALAAAALAIAGLAAMARWLGRRAALERAEAILDQELSAQFDRLPR